MAGLLEMEGAQIVSQLGKVRVRVTVTVRVTVRVRVSPYPNPNAKPNQALGGLISCELELKGDPCEIAPMKEVAGDTQAAMMR